MIKHILFFSLLVGSLYGSSDTLKIFFDTKDLYLLKNNITLKYQAKKYLSKKKKVKYEENITYNSKTNENIVFKVKHYNKVKFIEEKHPLLSLVKRKDRDSFINILKKDGIKYPLKLRYVLDTTSIEKTYEELFKSKAKDKYMFSIKFQYPYFINLLYALFISLFGLLIIYFLSRENKR